MVTAVLPTLFAVVVWVLLDPFFWTHCEVSQAAKGLRIVMTIPHTARVAQESSTQGMAGPYASRLALQLTLSELEARVSLGQKMKAPYTHLKHCQICTNISILTRPNKRWCRGRRGRQGWGRGSMPPSCPSWTKLPWRRAGWRRTPRESPQEGSARWGHRQWAWQWCG